MLRHHVKPTTIDTLNPCKHRNDIVAVPHVTQTCIDAFHRGQYLWAEAALLQWGPAWALLRSCHQQGLQSRTSKFTIVKKKQLNDQLNNKLCGKNRSHELRTVTHTRFCRHYLTDVTVINVVVGKWQDISGSPHHFCDILRIYT